MSRFRPTAAPGLAALLAAYLAFGAGSVAQAQQVYRIVGPDGKVTFSDKPPVEPAARTTAAPVASAGGNANASLPFELRQVANRYPVTLYTGPNCAPCGSGRSMLSARGIPFTEKTVNTNEDIQALQRLAGEGTLPLVTIGGQQIKGFSDVEWAQFLDAAGYPKTSALPASYRRPEPTPLVAVQRATAPAPSTQQATTAPRPAPVAQPSGPGPSNPAGIQF